MREHYQEVQLSDSEILPKERAYVVRPCENTIKKFSPWPKGGMEQVLQYNILDFSAWKDDSKFGDMFRKLIDRLELFYKG